MQKYIRIVQRALCKIYITVLLIEEYATNTIRFMRVEWFRHYLTHYTTLYIHVYIVYNTLVSYKNIYTLAGKICSYVAKTSLTK